MSTIEQSVDVAVPVETAYNQWTQFEEFPQFMEGVEAVTQLDDRRLHWVAQVAGQHREWDAVITEQIPDQRIAWRSTDGSKNAGVVTFHRLGDDRTKVMLQLEFDPEGPVEQVGDLLGLVEHRAAGDLERFRDFIEVRGQESGAWRGEVPRPSTNN
ncbi:MAG TPA: SRPBCC family protein [Acidimicrobiia bacterium]|nr:SRPBCC family protein [Acidimicrobiia bacterium]